MAHALSHDAGWSPAAGPPRPARGCEAARSGRLRRFLLLAAMLAVTAAAALVAVPHAATAVESDLRYPDLERQRARQEQQRRQQRRQPVRQQPQQQLVPPGYVPAPQQSRQQYAPSGGQVPQGYYARQGRRSAPPPPPPPQPRNIFEVLFGQSPTAPTYTPAPPQRVAPVERRVRPRPIHAAPKRKAPVVANEIKPKVNPSIFVGVVGDSMGELLSQGLDETFAEKPDIAVLRKAKGDSGLTRTDVYDWPRGVRELLAGSEKLNVGVVMLGVNDRQPIKDGDQTLEPGSERWNALYGARVDDLLKGFADKNVPVVWVGLPPMKNAAFGAEMAALNAIYKERAERAGAVFVDVWEAFADGDNPYSAYGPDVTGESAKLRTNDGVHFTKAGARKLAHFVGLAVSRILDARKPAAVASAPLGGAAGSDPAVLIDRAMVSLPEPPGIVSLPQKPAIGPVLPLTGAETAPGGVLLAASPRGASGSATSLEHTYGEGRPPEPRAGRADDFRWPRAGEDPAARPEPGKGM